jgi:EmrB/QacA subfamily drug resistance transporter
MSVFGVESTTAQWLTTGFTLVNAIMIPITAFLQDRFSSKALFISSVAIFLVGTLLAAVSWTFSVLLVGRIVQAVGAGILMPLSMTVLLVTFPIEKRGSAMGLFGLVIGFAPAIGPTLSGAIVDSADWHVMFYIVAVLSALVIVFAFIFMEGKKSGNADNSSLDVLSVVLSTLGFGGLLFGLSSIGSGDAGVLAVAAAIVGIVCVVWFFIRQKRLEVPLLHVEVLENRKFLIATIIGMLVQSSLLAATILMPIFIQSILGYKAIIMGLILMPGAIVTGIMSPVAGKLFDKHGPRGLGIAGTGLLLVASIGFCNLSLETTVIYMLVLYTVRMFAITIVNMPITTWGMNALDTRMMNHGTSVNNTLRQVAGSLGTALVVSVSSIVENANIDALGETQAAIFGTQIAFVVCCVIVAVAFVLTIIFVKPQKNTAGASASEASSAGAKAPAAAVKNAEGEVERTTVRAAGNANAGAQVAAAEGAFPKNTSPTIAQIMKLDAYFVRRDTTVQEAMQLFIDKGISACPIVDEAGEPCGFISDGDILKHLNRMGGTYTDPVSLISASAHDSEGYDERLAHMMQLPVTAVGIKKVISVDINADLGEVCSVLANNHLKKVPVTKDGRMVGVINRSDITHYSMEAYLAGHPEHAVYCEPDCEPAR